MFKNSACGRRHYLTSTLKLSTIRTHVAHAFYHEFRWTYFKHVLSEGKMKAVLKLRLIFCDFISQCPICIFTVCILNKIVAWFNMHYPEWHTCILGWPRNTRGSCKNLDWKRCPRAITASTNLHFFLWLELQKQDRAAKFKIVLFHLKVHV